MASVFPPNRIGLHHTDVVSQTKVSHKEGQGDSGRNRVTVYKGTIVWHEKDTRTMTDWLINQMSDYKLELFSSAADLSIPPVATPPKRQKAERKENTHLEPTLQS
jgi:hypothetical protein